MKNLDFSGLIQLEKSLAERFRQFSLSGLETPSLIGHSLNKENLLQVFSEPPVRPVYFSSADYLGLKAVFWEDAVYFCLRAFFPHAHKLDLLFPGEHPPKILLQEGGVYVWYLEDVHIKTLQQSLEEFGFSERGWYQFLLDDYQKMLDPYGLGSELDGFTRHLWNEGKLNRAYLNLGANFRELMGQPGFLFRTWAPHAKEVYAVGDWNSWDKRHPMLFDKSTGLWELFIPHAHSGEKYKYLILTHDGKELYKADPYAFRMEHPPCNASVLHQRFRVDWQDQAWLEKRKGSDFQHQPVSIFEVHLGSWRRNGDRFLSYQELEWTLVPYVVEQGFTHVEFMPLNEHPLDASWGYQPVGLYAPTVRFGTPEELKYLINAFHKAGIGVIMDWVPAHFPLDAHGLARYDGTALYEYEDQRKGYHPDWRTGIFNFSRVEVLNYLVSNAVYWMEEFHIDGIRVDAVSSMLYWSYSRKEGEWERNIHGGSENLEAIAFLKNLNRLIHHEFPGVLMFAEESTMFFGVTKKVKDDGLGFDIKWNLGWMHDTLDYIQSEEDKKREKHHQITHCIDYIYQENFLLPLSHDEVVHGKSPMIGKMPGFDEQKFALLRAYYSYLWAHPGKKLLFMGSEFAQRQEWRFEYELEWHLLAYTPHQGVQRLVQDLNRLYKEHIELYFSDFDPLGFQWIKKDSANEKIYAFLRMANQQEGPKQEVLVVINFSNQDFDKLGFGVSFPGKYRLIHHSSWYRFGGNQPEEELLLSASDTSWDKKFHSLDLRLPRHSTLFLRYEG